MLFCILYDSLLFAAPKITVTLFAGNNIIQRHCYTLVTVQFYIHAVMARFNTKMNYLSTNAYGIQKK